MNVKELTPPTTNRVKFSLQFQKFLPKSPGCYALSNIEGRVLYVGLTDNLFRRLGEHRSDRSKTDVTLEGRAVWFDFLVTPKNKINSIELAWLNQSFAQEGRFPLLNKKASPID